MDRARERIVEKIDDSAKELVSLSREIHDTPELSFEEYNAAKLLTEAITKRGFTVKKGIGGLETAFRADIKGKGEGPTMAFLAEYDALPGVGHGCGHNLIATAALGAAIGLGALADELDGTISLIGTPAEEKGGGKVIMLEKGCFDDVDFAMMIHPSTDNIICRGGLATRSISVEFFGKSAHSSSPEDGVNALQAVIQTFNAIDHLRPALPLKANINGIITDGGTATNIIPDHASCSFSVRADTVEDLEKVVEAVKKSVKAAEELTGGRGKVTMGRIYTERYPNSRMAERFGAYMASMGEKMHRPNPKAKYGSSDIGNVSLVLPVTHSYLKIAEPSVAGHSREFAEAAISDKAQKQLLNGAKAMAMTGLDILRDADLRKDIYEEFYETVPIYQDFPSYRGRKYSL